MKITIFNKKTNKIFSVISCLTFIVGMGSNNFNAYVRPPQNGFDGNITTSNYDNDSEFNYDNEFVKNDFFEYADENVDFSEENYANEKTSVSESKYSKKYKDELNEIVNYNNLQNLNGTDAIREYFDSNMASSLDKLNKIKNLADSEMEKLKEESKTSPESAVKYNVYEDFYELINEVYGFANECYNSPVTEIQDVMLRSLMITFYYITAEIYFDIIIGELPESNIKEVFENSAVFFVETRNNCEEILKNNIQEKN